MAGSSTSSASPWHGDVTLTSHHRGASMWQSEGHSWYIAIAVQYDVTIAPHPD